MLLSGAEVKCRLVEHLHKRFQTGNVDLVLYRLKMKEGFIQEITFKKIYTIIFNLRHSEQQESELSLEFYSQLLQE